MARRTNDRAWPAAQRHFYAEENVCEVERAHREAAGRSSRWRSRLRNRRYSRPKAKLLDSLHQMIDDDLAAHPVSQPKVIYLADYVDRGHDSKGVLDQLAAPPLARGLHGVPAEGKPRGV